MNQNQNTTALAYRLRKLIKIRKELEIKEKQLRHQLKVILILADRIDYDKEELKILLGEDHEEFLDLI